MGQAMHTILERAGIETGMGRVEDRLYMDVELPNGEYWTLSGQYDYIDEDGVLWDWKFVSVNEYINGVKDSRERQLNCYALLANRAFESELRITGLRVGLLFRDWSPIRAATDRTYPQSQAVAIDIPLWPLEVTEQYIRERAALHYEARRAVAENAKNPLVLVPECTPYDRWEKPTQYAVTKNGAKRAKRLLSSTGEAEEYAREQELSPGSFEIIQRIGESTRCRHYCPALKWCTQGIALNNRS